MSSLLVNTLAAPNTQSHSYLNNLARCTVHSSSDPDLLLDGLDLRSTVSLYRLSLEEMESGGPWGSSDHVIMGHGGGWSGHSASSWEEVKDIF